MRLHCEIAGTGPPIVLSHGLGDDASTWDALVPLLTRDHHVVRWDLRGHGRSQAPHQPEHYSSELGVADLLRVVSDLAPPVHMVGHSLGGYLALATALRHPDLVRSLTLVSSGPGYRDAQARESWNQTVARAVQRMPIPAAASGLARQEDSRVIDDLPGLAPPLLVIVGDRDERFQAGAAYLARTVPGATLLPIAGAGHHPQRTHPDEVATAILRLLGANG